MRFSPLLALVLAAGCARFVPQAPKSQTVYAGEPSRIALREKPPEGTELRWNAGDGTKAEEGPELVHAWQRPGTYTVKVEGPGGADSFQVEVLPRPVLRAVPAGVELAAAFPELWTRAPEFLRFASRLVGNNPELRDQIQALYEKLGLGDGASQNLEENGIDPAEGMAFVRCPEDPEGIWYLIGTLDDERALNFGAQTSGAEDLERIESAGGPLYVGANAEGQVIALGVTNGYLALRLEGSPGDIEGAFARIAKLPDGSLGDRESFRKARALAPGEDAIVYVEVAGDQAGGEKMPFAVGVDFDIDRSVMRFGMPLAPNDVASARSLFDGVGARPDSLARFPAGAVAFAEMTLVPSHLVQLIAADPVKGAALEGMVLAKTGIPLDRLLAGITGHVSGALFLDADALLGALIGAASGQGSEAELIPPAAIRVGLAGDPAFADALRGALKKHADRQAGAWSMLGKAGVQVQEERLTVATERAIPVLAGGDAVDFSQRIDRKLLGDPRRFVIFLDVQPILRGLRNARIPEGPDRLQTSMFRQMLLEKLSVIEALDTVLMHGTVAEEGVTGELDVRLLPEQGTAMLR